MTELVGASPDILAHVREIARPVLRFHYDGSRAFVRDGGDDGRHCRNTPGSNFEPEPFEVFAKHKGCKHKRLPGLQLISQSEENSELVKVDIRATIRELLGQLQLTLGEKINLTVLLDKQPANVLLGSGVLEQIVTRLTANAHDAMPQGGQLCISTRIKTLSNHESLTSGAYVELVMGWGEADIPKLVEPTSTTSIQDGLNIAQTLVKEAHGCMTTSSDEGSTTFKILLPTCERDASCLSELGGTETILLVDDSSLIRQLVRQVLTKKGYSVISAEDGPKALGLLNDTDTIPDLLLTDIMMPHMSGLELASKLRESSHETKIVFMSGHTDDDGVAQGCREREASLLAKPFTPSKLLEAVRASLDHVLVSEK